MSRSASAIALGLVIAASANLNGAAAQTQRACTPQAATPSSTLQTEAQQAFRQQRFAAAYGRFMRLADSGDPAAAEIALLMHDQGASLFGQEWSASAPQLTCWRLLSLNRARNKAWPAAASAAAVAQPE